MSVRRIGVCVGAGVAIAMAGCMPYSRPTLRPGSNVAVSKPVSPGKAIVGALLCSAGVSPDTNKVAPSTSQRTCVAGEPKDSVLTVKPPR